MRNAQKCTTLMAAKAAAKTKAITSQRSPTIPHVPVREIRVKEIRAKEIRAREIRAREILDLANRAKEIRAREILDLANRTKEIRADRKKHD